MARREKRLLDEEIVGRRLDFLMTEARQSEPIYDQTVRMAFRVISNAFCIGWDCQSRDAYKESKYRSQKAHQLIDVSPLLPGKSKLHNEHQEPLNLVWKWMCEAPRTKEEIVARLKKWPMVVITDEENRKIPSKESDPVARYRHIAVLEKNAAGAWLERVAGDEKGAAS